MKKILLFCCLFAATASTAHDFATDDPKTEATPRDCVVTLTSIKNCLQHAVECYKTTWNGGNHEFEIHVMAMSTGYKIDYTTKYDATLYLVPGSFETKREAIANFVHEVYGTSCTFQYN